MKKYWYTIHSRGLASVAVWQTHTPIFICREVTAASHATDVNLLHDHLQQCNDAEDALDIARIARDGAATTIRDLYTRACQAVLGNLPVGDGMRGEVLDVRRVKGKSQTGVIDKGRKPVSLWQNVNTHRAGMSPGQSPLLVGTTGVGEF